MGLSFGTITTIASHPGKSYCKISLSPQNQEHKINANTENEGRKEKYSHISKGGKKLSNSE